MSVAETGSDDGPARCARIRILDGVVTEEEIEITGADPAGIGITATADAVV